MPTTAIIETAGELEVTRRPSADVRRLTVQTVRAPFHRAELIDVLTDDGAHAYAATEDADALLQLAEKTAAFLAEYKALVLGLHYGQRASVNLDCIIEQLEEPMTYEAAAYFCAELASIRSASLSHNQGEGVGS